MIHVDERHFGWVYSATALLGLVLLVFLPSSSAQVPRPARRAYAALQGLTLAGAIVGAKLAFLAGDLDWPRGHVTLDDVVFSGRSITGGLLGGFLAAELGKVALGYRELPNDWFAAKLPISIGVGRIGCVLAGCCRGTAGDYPLAFVYSDGVPRFPAQLCELCFQIVAFGVAYALYRRGALRGRVFAVYMISYGVFRFGIEAVRDTPKQHGGLSAYQLLSLALAACGLASFAWYGRRLARRTA